MTWYLESGPACDVVLSTRVRLARNLDGTPFPWRLSDRELADVKVRVTDAFKAICASSSGALIVDLGTLDAIETLALAERRVISRDMLRHAERKALLLFPGESQGILVNEEDHLRIYAVGAGLCLNETLDDVMRCARSMEAKLSFAKTDRMGYLTACPTNTGTAMRASAMLHVPALARAGVLPRMTEHLARAGYALRGAGGEGTGMTGDVIQLSNQVTLGVTEAKLTEDLERLILDVADEERRARQALLDEDPVGLLDAIGRAKGRLMFAHQLTTDEAMESLSLVRLGRELELSNMPDYDVIQSLWVGVGAGVIQQEAGRPLSAQARDEARADKVREALASGIKS